jgi:hypothetical protein
MLLDARCSEEGKVGSRRVSGKKACLAIVVALATSITTIGQVDATGCVPNFSFCYAGEYSSGYYLGIDGYIRQSRSVRLYSPQHHADWFNVCQLNNCNHWVQLGAYQGYLVNSNSPDYVHIFYENVNECPANNYSQGDKGAPPSVDYPYYVTSKDGPFIELCSDLVYHTFYTFEYRKGSFTNAPFFIGHLGAGSGVVVAKTDI